MNQSAPHVLGSVKLALAFLVSLAQEARMKGYSASLAESIVASHVGRFPRVDVLEEYASDLEETAQSAARPLFERRTVVAGAIDCAGLPAVAAAATTFDF